MWGDGRRPPDRRLGPVEPGGAWPWLFDLHPGADVLARRRADEHAEDRTPAAQYPDAIDGAEGRRALSRQGHARWRPAGSMVADLLSAPPASSAEPAGSDRRALVPQRALPELVLATRGQEIGRAHV